MREYQEELADQKPNIYAKPDIIVMKGRCIAFAEALARMSQRGLLYSIT